MVAKNDYGTKMDDVILESLKPQVEEIKQKLASGGSLSQSDIITLTLYAQGNHINHIDMRMDSLDEKFNDLRLDFANLRADIYEKISGFEHKVGEKISGLENKISEFRSDFSKMTAIIGGICAAGIAISAVITR